MTVLARLKSIGLYVACFTVAAFLILSLRLEHQQKEINQSIANDRATLYASQLVAFKQCQISRSNGQHFNDLVNTLIMRIRNAPDISRSDMEQGVAMYSAVLQKLPTCVAPHPPTPKAE